MADRNTPLISEIITALGDMAVNKEAAEGVLKEHFKDCYILDAGDVNDVADFAETLRRSISEEERAGVLDHIAEKAMVGISLDIVEEAINEQFVDRFIEPEN